VKLARVFLAAALLTIVGCGIGTSDRVEQVDPELLGLLAEPTTTTSTTVPETPGSVESSTTVGTPGGDDSTTVPTETIHLYFIEASELSAIDGEVPAGARLRQRLRLLEEVPPAYAEAGLRTAVAPGLISGTELWGTDGVNVNMDGELFAEIDDDDQPLMIGQIVLTVTDEEGIEQVSFSVDRQPIPVFLRDGTLGEPGEAVGRADYEVLLADGSTTAANTATTVETRSSVSLDSGP
jgi:sporulation and spore germination protein